MGEDRPPTGRRLTVGQTATTLGISADAVRSRIKRGTLAAEREPGRVWVLLDADRPPPGQDQPTDQPTPDHTAELIRTLQEQLAAERQAHAEARRIIAGLVERIPPAIEAPRESSDTPSEPTQREDAFTGEAEPEERPTVEGVQRRTWLWWWTAWILLLLLLVPAMWIVINLF